MLKKSKNQTIQRPKASVDFFETKKTRIAIIFHMTCLTAPHLLYEPDSSQKLILILKNIKHISEPRLDYVFPPFFSGKNRKHGKH